MCLAEDYTQYDEVTYFDLRDERENTSETALTLKVMAYADTLRPYLNVLTFTLN